MAQLPAAAAAAVAVEEEAAALEDALDLDESDIRLDPPAPSRSCTTTPSHKDKLTHPSHHRVPEPAAAVQDRMRRSAASSPLARRRADAQAPDADFLLPPWLCALQFLGKGRAWEQPGIKDIKDKDKLHRAPLVAGVVTSCKPNGLGDLLVTLKAVCGKQNECRVDLPLRILAPQLLLQYTRKFFWRVVMVRIYLLAVIILSKVSVFRPTRKTCYLNITRVIKVFRKDCDAPSKQVISSNTTERSEDFTNNIMMRLVDHERTMPSNTKMTVTEVSLEHRGTLDSSNGTSAQDISGRCSVGDNQEEGGLHMLAGDPRSKRTLNCSTDGYPPKQSLNIPNTTCKQPSTRGRTAMFGDRYCTQPSDNENLRRPFDNGKMLHISKKLKSDAVIPEGSGETANLRTDTENNSVSERNMNIELDDMAEQHASVREPIHQQNDFLAANAGSIRPTKEHASAISANKAVPVASGAEWTDEQLCQLFLDY